MCAKITYNYNNLSESIIILHVCIQYIYIVYNFYYSYTQSMCICHCVHVISVHVCRTFCWTMKPMGLSLISFWASWKRLWMAWKNFSESGLDSFDSKVSYMCVCVRSKYIAWMAITFVSLLKILQSILLIVDTLGLIKDFVQYAWR